MSVSFYARQGGDSIGSRAIEVEGPNFHEAGAAAVLCLLRFDTSHGMIGSCTIPEMRRALILAINTADRRAPEYAIEPSESGGPGTGQCHVVNFGMTTSSISDRLARLATFVERAACSGADTITWG
jgi:hypothetical protein